MKKMVSTKNNLLRQFMMFFMVIIISVSMWNPFEVYAEQTTFAYAHDPMQNAKAAEDIVVNPNAVYGYSPSPTSTRLKAFIDQVDWTDPTQVESARQKRIEYHTNNMKIYDTVINMKKAGNSTEEIARAASQLRNEIRLASYVNDPAGLAAVKKSNLETYGHEEGPAADDLFAKYGSWEKVIEKSMSTNPGMDACLGLYDQYYYTYDVLAVIEAQPNDTTYIVQPNDSLWTISESYYHDGKLWNKIYEYNKETISNPDLIRPGQTIKLPKVA